MTDELPAGWRRVRLGDVADTALGKMLDRGKVRGGKQVPYLRNVNVQWGRIDTHDVAEMELLDDELARFEVRAGDLLVCEGGEIGRCAIWPGSDTYMAYQKALHRVRPGPDVDARFLRYALEGQARRGELARRATGSTIKHLPQVALRELPLSLPSLDEQCRIVVVLEDHLSRLAAAGKYAGAAKARSNSLLQACRDTVSNSGESVPLESLLAEPLRNGHSAPASRSGNIRTLTLTAVTTGAFEDRHTKLTAADSKRVEGLWLRKGDILVQRSNTPQLVGTSAMYGGPERWAIFPDLLIRVRVDADRVRPAYAALALMSTRSRRRFRGLAKGLADSMPKIDQAAIATAPICVPDLRKQDEAIQQLDHFAQAQRRLTASCRKATVGVKHLRDDLLTRAFRGEL